MDSDLSPLDPRFPIQTGGAADMPLFWALIRRRRWRRQFAVDMEVRAQLSAVPAVRFIRPAPPVLETAPVLDALPQIAHEPDVAAPDPARATALLGITPAGPEHVPGGRWWRPACWCRQRHTLAGASQLNARMGRRPRPMG
jgi:hypothetical protein